MNILNCLYYAIYNNAKDAFCHSGWLNFKLAALYCPHSAAFEDYKTWSESAHTAYIYFGGNKKKKKISIMKTGISTKM